MKWLNPVMAFALSLALANIAYAQEL